MNTYTQTENLEINGETVRGAKGKPLTVTPAQTNEDGVTVFCLIAGEWEARKMARHAVGHPFCFVASEVEILFDWQANGEANQAVCAFLTAGGDPDFVTGFCGESRRHGAE